MTRRKEKKEIRASYSVIEEKINQLVKDFIMEKFRREYGLLPNKQNNQERYHLANCSKAWVVDSDMEWRCGCYSDVTREDDCQLLTRIGCPCLSEKNYQVYSWTKWGSVPDVIRELYERSREEDLPNKCQYEADERAGI